MNKKYSVSNMRKLATDKNLTFVSKTYTSCDIKHTWQCCVCNHIWRATPANILHNKSGCPSCVGHCQSVETMHELAKSCGLEFLSNYYKTMKTKYKWKCQNGHISSITACSVKYGTGCPYCHKGIKEEECRFVFESTTKYKFPTGRIRHLELDGYCPELNLAFEYNGKQHYEFMPFFHKTYDKFEEQIKRDKAKTEACREASIIKFDIPYYKAVEQDSLTKHIILLLNSVSIPIQNSVNWQKFHGKRKFLEETINNAKRINAICLSKIYFTAKTKMEFQCKECGHIWWSTPSNIKTGYGCIKCSYKVKRWQTRRAKKESNA